MVFAGCFVYDKSIFLVRVLALALFGITLISVDPTARMIQHL